MQRQVSLSLEWVRPVGHQLCLLDLDSSCHSQLVSGLILSFESRLISQPAHAESDPASDGLPDESPVH